MTCQSDVRSSVQCIVYIRPTCYRTSTVVIFIQVSVVVVFDSFIMPFVIAYQFDLLFDFSMFIICEK